MEREIERILAPLVPHLVLGASGAPGALLVVKNATHIGVYRTPFIKPEVVMDRLGLPVLQRFRHREYPAVKIAIRWGDDLVGMPAAFIAGCLYARLLDIPGAITPLPLE